MTMTTMMVAVARRHGYVGSPSRSARSRDRGLFWGAALLMTAAPGTASSCLAAHCNPPPQHHSSSILGLSLLPQ